MWHNKRITDLQSFICGLTEECGDHSMLTYWVWSISPSAAMQKACVCLMHLVYHLYNQQFFLSRILPAGCQYVYGIFLWGRQKKTSAVDEVKLLWTQSMLCPFQCFLECQLICEFLPWSHFTLFPYVCFFWHLSLCSFHAQKRTFPTKIPASPGFSL